MHKSMTDFIRATFASNWALFFFFSDKNISLQKNLAVVTDFDSVGHFHMKLTTDFIIANALEFFLCLSQMPARGEESTCTYLRPAIFVELTGVRKCILRKSTDNAGG